MSTALKVQTVDLKAITQSHEQMIANKLFDFVLIHKAFDIADALLDSDLINIHYNDDELLWYACDSGHLDIIEYLKSKGANPFFGMPVAWDYINDINELNNKFVKKIILDWRREVLCAKQSTI